MGNSHGNNSATAGRAAAAAAQTAQQQGAQQQGTSQQHTQQNPPQGGPQPHTAPPATPSEAQLTRAVASAQRAHDRALAAADRAEQQARAARQRWQDLDQQQWNPQRAAALHNANVRAAIRMGRTSAPELVDRLEAARATTRERIATQRSLVRTGQRLDRQLQRDPHNAETRSALNDLRRELSRIQQATGEAALAEGDAELRLIHGTLGQVDLSTQIRQAQEAARQAGMRAAAAQGRARDTHQQLQQALTQLDLAHGGTGVLGTNSATERAALATATGLFGRPMTVGDFGKMVGAKPGDTIHLGGGPTQVTLNFTGANRNATMEFSRQGSKLTVHVGWAGQQRGERTGASGRELLRSMQAMHDAGVQRVTATAGGHGGSRFGPGMNGYYTWARMGFTGRLSTYGRRDAAAHFGLPLTTVQAVMQQPGGPQWWKQHGESFAATFDWSNSYSRSTFERLLAAANRGGGDQNA